MTEISYATVSNPMKTMYLCHSWSDANSIRARKMYHKVFKAANTSTVM